jgi:hypothetical protein
MHLSDIDSQCLMATRDGAGGFVDGAGNEPSPTDPSR